MASGVIKNNNRVRHTSIASNSSISLQLQPNSYALIYVTDSNNGNTGIYMARTNNSYVTSTGKAVAYSDSIQVTPGDNGNITITNGHTHGVNIVINVLRGSFVI